MAGIVKLCDKAPGPNTTSSLMRENVSVVRIGIVTGRFVGLYEMSWVTLTGTPRRALNAHFRAQCGRSTGMKGGSQNVGIYERISEKSIPHY